jgi:hypothetical protein
MVRGLVPSVRPISLFDLPATINSSTSRSRGLGRGRRLGERPAIGVQGLPDGAGELAVLEGLFQEIHRTRLQRANGHRNITMGCHDDDRQPHAALGQTRLKLQAVDLGHAEIGHHAAGGRQLRHEQRLRVRIGPNRETFLFQREAKRVPDRFVIVHDMHRTGHGSPAP